MKIQKFKNNKILKYNERSIEPGLKYFKKNLLITDDEYNYRSLYSELISVFFNKNIVNIFEAATPIEAIDIIEGKNGKINLVITDIVKPIMDGFTMSKIIKNKYSHIKIFVITLSANTSDLEYYLKKNIIAGWERKRGLTCKKFIEIVSTNLGIEPIREF